ncbi:adenylyl cyclase CyaB [Pirellula staleyi DSM 6068]|uniref:Adenylyl cyclase CyaB n=1 Tax=Pirellula staleyi (strain ATCC 27377 / DSM 6068 / ICPB 4128) TaxID=530564 RepID=D2R0I6_PIRSD|nr:class IV adenylate cyclase [Pirellula staleyi]ADB14854.1 adenylyl cyclase CyaB [Pirellula staleyi DSM 6068]
MNLEVELKFVARDLERAKAQLVALGASFHAPLRQLDRYFSHPSRDFRATDEALRLRAVGEENCITYKGPKLDSHTKTRRELELAILPGDAGIAQFSELLSHLGFVAVGEVRKVRTPGELIWNGEVVELSLDEVAGLGGFVELERVVDEQQLTAARQTILSLAQTLGLTDSVRRGYLDLILDQSSAS